MRKRRRLPANDNRRPPPYGIVVLLFLFVVWFGIVQAVVTVLKGIFG